MKPHIAVLPSAGMGHIIPLFQLAKQLAVHHRFHVSFLLITTQSSAAQNQFFQSAAVPDMDIVELPAADVSTLITDDMRVVTQLSVIVHESLKPLKSVLLKLPKKPSVLIIDIFTTDAIDVCAELSIPIYSFFTASTNLLTFSLYLPKLDAEVEGEFVDLPEPIEIPGCNPVRIEDLLDQVQDRKNDEYKWYKHHASLLTATSGIFVNSWYDLDPIRLEALKEEAFFKSIKTPPVFPIGPLVKDIKNVSNEKNIEILEWMDSQPWGSILFVCLGSGGTLSSKQLIELAWGLEMSEQRFILVGRPPSDVSASAKYFDIGGDDGKDLLSYFPDGFVKRTGGVGLIVPAWAPQLEILSHRATGAFLSHCGWNSTLESLVHGVPMIAFPLYAEQRMNATMLVEEVGVAKRLGEKKGRGEVVGREEVEKVIRSVMEGEDGKAMRRKAEEFKESALKELATYRSLHTAFQCFKK